MVIIILFSRDLNTLDIIISGGILLLNHPEVISRMQNLSFIVMGIVVPLVLCPIMLDIWVRRGSGNANYFFFQGLCLWLFCALGITEFSAALLKYQTKNCNCINDIGD